jgi:site-specific recombinase XerC
MEQTRQEYLIRYLEYLCNANVTSRKLGESMKYVAHFLEHAESISRKGYQQYRQSFASDMALAPGYSDCVLDLLGHGSIDTTRIYLQKSYDEQQRDFNRNVTW